MALGTPMAAVLVVTMVLSTRQRNLGLEWLVLLGENLILLAKAPVQVITLGVTVSILL